MPAAARIEGRFTHQAMDARFSAQRAVCIFAFHLDRDALDTRHLACRFLKQSRLKPFALTIASIQSKQHCRPVARFGAARTRLKLAKTMIRIGGLIEHTEEIDFCD